MRHNAEQGLAIAAETGNRRVQARGLVLLGAVHQSDGDLDAAERRMREALTIAEEAGAREPAVQSLMFIAAGAEWRGRFSESAALSRQAAEAAALLHEGFFELFALSFECLAHIGLGAYADAVAVDGLAKSRDRNNGFFEGRLLNSLGWLHQELGDFPRARELDLESEALGRRNKTANVEISAAINLAFDALNLGEPARAVAQLAELQERAGKMGFGSHRWRWPIHIACYLAEALLATGRPQEALLEVDTALAQARATGSTKYVGKCHALQGLIALDAGDHATAERELREALRVAQEIGYPTLTWQAAHALAEALARQDKRDDAWTAARLAADTIASVADRAPSESLKRTFLAWDRVAAVEQSLDRLRRG